MATVFDPFEDEVSAVVDEVFGEQFEHRPMKHAASVNARRVVDPDRALSTVTAVMDKRVREFGRAREFGRVPEAMLSSGVRAPGSWLSIDDREFSSGVLPRQGDRMRRNRTGEVFEIVTIDADGLGRSKIGIRHVAREEAA